MGTIALQGVGKRFGLGKAALQDICLDAGGGDIVGVVGPSGAGKSTLLRLIAGLERDGSGLFIGFSNGHVFKG